MNKYELITHDITKTSTHAVLGKHYGTVDMVITSPPYNVGIEYDTTDDKTPRIDYETFTDRYIDICHSMLRPDGRIAVNVANTGRNPYVDNVSMVSRSLERYGFTLRGHIIWDKAASAGGSCAWGSWKSAANPTLRDVNEFIVVAHKDKPKKETPGTSDIDRDDFMEWTKSIWTMRTESAKRIGHPAPFPVELPRRLIKLYTYVGDIVFDPFSGSGSTGVAAVEGGRYYIGMDSSQVYNELADARINAVTEL